MFHVLFVDVPRKIGAQRFTIVPNPALMQNTQASESVSSHT